MKKLSQLFAWIIPAFLFVSLALSPVSAFFAQSGESLVIPKEKKIDETAFLASQALTINSDINGDLYCAGADIIINGNIKGDIVCAGQSIKINGNVDGNVRAAAQNIEISGTVSRNVTVIAQGLSLGEKSNVKGDIFFGVQNLNLGGNMGRDLAGAGESINITGSLLRNATITGTNISVAETAKVGGNLDYYIENPSTIAIDQKNVKGTLTKHIIESPSKSEIKKEDMARFTREAMVYRTIFGIISFALLGLTLVYFDKKNTEKRIAKIAAKPLVSGLIGFAVLITAPFAFLILMITLVGMPLAFIALFVYIIALMTASLYPSAIYGKYVIEKIFKKQKSSLNMQVLVGVLVLGILSIIPIVGWILAFVSFCMGLGAFFTSMAPEKA